MSRLIVVIFVFLCLLQRLLMGVQPMPDGATLSWSPPSLPGWSNIEYSVWAFLPNSTNAIYLTNTIQLTYRIAGPIITGTMFGVATIAQTNGVWRTGDVGIAHWPPDIAYGPGSVLLTPKSPWTVPTNQWLKQSSDMKTWETIEKFGFSGSNVLVWFRDITNGRAGFFAVPSPTNPPSFR
jgi:hypothetical protein